MQPSYQTNAQTNAAVAIRCCRNIDEQAMLLDAWNQSYCQISRGAFDGSVTSISAGGVRVLVERLNRAVYQRGQVAATKIAVGVPFQLEGHSLLCGQTSHRDGLHVFSGNGGFEFLSPDKHVVVNLEIEPGAIADGLMRAQLDELSPLLGPGPGILNVDPTRLQGFRSELKQILDTVAATPTLLDDPGVAATFEKSVIFGLADVLHDVRAADPHGHLEARTSRNWQLVRSVRELVEDSPDCPLSVAELCARFRASRRTLQYAFEETLGVNPSAYVRAVRLHHVRRGLRDAASVTEVATRWGFWHFGNFSNEYREQFGELPSETFRHAKGRSA